MQLTFKVTAEIVSSSTRSHCLACPVDRALDEAVRLAGINAIPVGAFLDTKKTNRAIARLVVKTEDRRLLRYQAELGEETAARMRKFDETGEMEPFEQTITFKDTGNSVARIVNGIEPDNPSTRKTKCPQ